jgi:hypothetical protein
MPFDPSLPANGSPNSSAQMRGQLQGLKELIDAIATVSGAQVDGVNTLNPGEPAAVDLSVVGSVLHFTFGIPRGNDGSNGTDGTSVSGGVVDSVTTLDPNQGATVNVNFDPAAQVLHFSFGIPRGEQGVPGPQGVQGPAFGNAVVDMVSTLDPGQPAWVSGWFDGSVVHFSFGIPRGQDGAPGAPGEVSAAQLNNAIGGTSNNSNTVGTLGIAVSDPPTQGEMQQVVGKLDELILALRR